MSSAALETITFSVRDFFCFLSSPPLAVQVQGEEEKKEFPLIRHSHLDILKRPFHLFSCLMEKYRAFAHHPPTHSLVWWHLIFLSCSSVCTIRAIYENNWRMTFRQTNPCLCKHSHEGRLLMSGDTA